jgi:hypothetical protein
MLKWSHHISDGFLFDAIGYRHDPRFIDAIENRPLLQLWLIS